MSDIKLGKTEIAIGDEHYGLIYDTKDPYITSGYKVCYCDSLADDYKPIFYDPKGWGITPFPPEYLAYRIIQDPTKMKLCLIYELYWSRQDCTWREMNKDHDFDYEQIQVHIDQNNSVVEKVVVSSIGPAKSAFHGVEVYSNKEEFSHHQVDYKTSSFRHFPWGGLFGKNRLTFVRNIPLKNLEFDVTHPVMIVINCYHAFTGSKGNRDLSGSPMLKPDLKRLDQNLLNKWYRENKNNRYGRDLSKAIQCPFVMYSPPPDQWILNIYYDILWRIFGKTLPRD